MACCCKLICLGCCHANKQRQLAQRLQPQCIFCRCSVSESEEQVNIKIMKRIEANDPVAMYQKGGNLCINGDYKKALGYLSKAAAMGNVDAHFNLASMYQKGDGVEKDEEKEVYHLEQAAIGGNPDARTNLAGIEGGNGREDRSIKHLIIGANMGHDKSLGAIKSLFQLGAVSKEDFAAVLRGHQAAVDATKSPQREEADAFLSQRGYL